MMVDGGRQNRENRREGRIELGVAGNVCGIEAARIYEYAARMPHDDDSPFVSGVLPGYVLKRLAKADGNEVTGGKLASPQSSAALAVNTFAWFHYRPNRLPPIPTLGNFISRTILVEVEYCARFPWSGEAEVAFAATSYREWLESWPQEDSELTAHRAAILRRFSP